LEIPVWLQWDAPIPPFARLVKKFFGKPDVPGPVYPVELFVNYTSAESQKMVQTGGDSKMKFFLENFTESHSD